MPDHPTTLLQESCFPHTTASSFSDSHPVLFSYSQLKTSQENPPKITGKEELHFLALLFFSIFTFSSLTLIPSFSCVCTLCLSPRFNGKGVLVSCKVTPSFNTLETSTFLFLYHSIIFFVSTDSLLFDLITIF